MRSTCIGASVRAVKGKETGPHLSQITTSTRTISIFPSYTHLTQPSHLTSLTSLTSGTTRRFGATTQFSPPPRTEWYLREVGRFLEERSETPDGNIMGFSEEEIEVFTPEIKRAVHLKCGSAKEASHWRKDQMRKVLQPEGGSSDSLPVRISNLTEEILSLRRHVLYLRDPTAIRWLSYKISKRHKLMKDLYKQDFRLYTHTCHVLGLKMISFAIPHSRHIAQRPNPTATDADRLRFLIRKRAWESRRAPRMFEWKGHTYRFTRYPTQEPPPNFGNPVKVKDKISRFYPYGVRDERIKGKHVLLNPVAPGRKHEVAEAAWHLTNVAPPNKQKPFPKRMTEHYLVRGH
eukprot:GHVN01041503.1.p1 GENE.GHVN01041503.1~~GHVN01041503.1.p1  ORF type:complete len:347 (+),score=64.71 GHVN01041503.1:184-1224(+)